MASYEKPEEAPEPQDAGQLLGPAAGLRPW